MGVSFSPLSLFVDGSDFFLRTYIEATVMATNHTATSLVDAQKITALAFSQLCRITALAFAVVSIA
jgi:hypothetical protein